MASKRVLIACLSLIVLFSAWSPYIEVYLDEREVAEFNAGHEARLKEWQEAMTEYETEKRARESGSGGEADLKPRGEDGPSPDFVLLYPGPPQKPMLKKPNRLLSIHASSDAQSRGAITLLLCTGIYLSYARKDRLRSVWNSFKSQWTTNAENYQFRPIQRALLFLLGLIASWQSYVAYDDERHEFLLAASVVAIAALTLALSKRRTKPSGE